MNTMLNPAPNSLRSPGPTPPPFHETDRITCKKCGGVVFNEGLLLRSYNRFKSGTPNDQIVPIVVFYCATCKTPLTNTLSDAVVADLETYLKEKDV